MNEGVLGGCRVLKSIRPDYLGRWKRSNQSANLLRIGSPAGTRNRPISLSFHGLNSGKATVHVRIGTQRTGVQQTALPNSSATPRAGNRRQLFRSHVDHSH